MIESGEATLIGKVGSARLFRRHLSFYLCLGGGLILINIILGAGWWSFWAIYGWGLLLALHFFVYRSMNAPEDWIDDRARQLRAKAYDFGHIRDMEGRIVSRDFSLLAPTDEQIDKQIQQHLDENDKKE